MTRAFRLPDAAATERLGADLAALARPGLLLALSGPLGAGKTCLARGLIRRLGLAEDEDIVSPTFTLVQTYPTEAGMVWHFDLYRLKHPDEAIELGFEDALGEICVVEWPDRLGRQVPGNRIDVVLAQAGSGRTATVIGHGTFAAAVAGWRPSLGEGQDA
jgi:tRNA threonylcarbamoyladenosine biosynthesis protein TsaE